MKKYLTIDTDNLFISERLKQIDESYFILYNLNNKKFEIHSSMQSNNTYCLTIPFDRLDERTLCYARKTRAENLDRLMEEMDKQNEMLERKRLKNAVDSLKEVIYDS